MIPIKEQGVPDEKVMYRGKPSQYVNAITYSSCGFIMALALLSPLLWEMFITGGEGHYGYYSVFWKIAFWVSFAMIVWAWLKIWNHHFELTTERFRETQGVFNRVEQVIELYRVRDITFVQPFALRVLGLGNIILDTSDRSNPIIVIYAIREGKKISDMIRQNVEEARLRRGIQQIERM
jgi:uncharacterized membrane protein YdbT with pleckstrin-like domain